MDDLARPLGDLLAAGRTPPSLEELHAPDGQDPEAFNALWYACAHVVIHCAVNHQGISMRDIFETTELLEPAEAWERIHAQ